MDIFLNIVLLAWFLLSLIIVCWIAYSIFVGNGGAFEGWGFSIFSILVFIFFLILVLNNYLGNEIIEGTVYAVSKTGSDETVKVELSESISTEIEPSREMLKSYEVAIYPGGSKKVRILKNNNSLWRLKFNKREIQLQLEPDKKYRFRVHRLFLGKNILDIQEQ